jgi:putative peptidoglycan lipid II flippase
VTGIRNASSPPGSSRATHVARSSLLIAAFFAVDKALGLGRQVIIGRQFGVSAELDAFNAANNLPDLLFALISGGALGIALIPVLSESKELEGRDAAWTLLSRIANWAFLITGALAVVIALFADSIVRAEIGVAPGFTPELQSVVARLMRMNLIATMIFSLSGLAMAGLQSNQHFLLPAIAPSVYDIGQIFGALILAPSVGIRLGSVTLPALGLGVDGLVYGVILGACLHLGVQIPGLMRYRFRWSPQLGLHQEGVRKVARLLGPRILTIGTFQLVFVVQDNLASRLEVGSVAVLAYGWLIMQVPETIIATALGTALLPTLGEQFARGDWEALQGSLQRALRSILALTIPSFALLFVAIRPLVEAAFGFDVRGTELVVAASRAFLIGLVGHSILEVAARGFYAQQNARVPLLAAATRVVAYFAFGLLLFRPLGTAGLGLSNSLAFTLEAMLLLALLARRLPGVLRLGRVALRVSAGTALACLVTYGFLRMELLPPLLSGGAALALGGAIALPFSWPEISKLRSL